MKILQAICELQRWFLSLSMTFIRASNHYMYNDSPVVIQYH